MFCFCFFCHCEHFLYRRRENIRKQTKKRHRRAKLHFQYCLVSAGFSFTVICLLEICNFWNYYFICIVWSHRRAVSRHCHRHNIFIFIRINIGGSCLSCFQNDSTRLHSKTRSTLLTIAVADKIDSTKTLVECLHWCSFKVSPEGDIINYQLRIFLQNESSTAENWQNKRC